MLDKRLDASVLLLVFLFLLNILHDSLSRGSVSAPECRKSFFVEIAEQGKRPVVLAFCTRPSLEVVKRCGFRNGLSVKIFKDGTVICRTMSAYKRITLGIPISINREGIYGLCAIPGIGPYLAKQIVKERRSRGGFNSLEELMQVKGIGKKLYNKILPYISL